jgi:hypothetical protein
MWQPDDAWCVELSEAVPAPAAWAEIPDAETYLPGVAFLVAVVPDEDPDLSPPANHAATGQSGSSQ